MHAAALPYSFGKRLRRQMRECFVRWMLSQPRQLLDPFVSDIIALFLINRCG